MNKKPAPKAKELNAVLASASVYGWSGQRTDAEISQEVAAMKGAATRAGRYVKNLIDPAALRGVRSAAMFVRQLHYDLTRPWDEGRRLLPAGLADDYTARMDEALALHRQAVDQLMSEYPNLIRQAEQDLGQMFDADAYPPVEDIPKMFRAEYHFEPVPSGDALPPAMKGLAEAVEERTRRTLTESHEALFYRTRDALRELHRKLVHLDAKKKAGEITKLRSSLLHDVKILARILPELNVENDPFLNGIANRFEVELSGLKAETIRDDEARRRETMAKVEAMMAMMEDAR